MILAPAPVGIVLLPLPAPAALLGMEMLSLIVRVDRALTTVAPDDRLMGSIYFHLEGHVRVAG
jgi:hypothetical protein